MQIAIYELKKMFVCQKGLLFVALFFMFGMAALIITDAPMNPGIEQNLSAYNAYMEQLAGHCTSETELFMSDESKRITDANVALTKLYNNYYDGHITKEAMHTGEASIEVVIQNQKGFDTIYEQFLYARENTDNRYFLNTNGWAGLLSGERLDLLFVLLVVLLTAPIFCYEYESAMDTLVRTTKMGAIRQTFCKIGVALLVVTILSTLDTCRRYAFFQIKYGLDHGNYPLQSLSYFASSSRQVSLFGTFILTSLSRLLGSAFFAALVLMIAVMTKKYVHTVFLSIAIIVIPYFALGTGSLKYCLPLPLGFMIATGLFRGNEFSKDIFTEEVSVVFKEITTLILTIWIVVALTIGVAAIFVVLKKSANRWGQNRWLLWLKSSHTPKLLILFFTLCAIVVHTTGCAAEQATQRFQVYNYETRRHYENDRYRIYVDESDLYNEKLVFEDKTTGVTRDLMRNPLQALTVPSLSVFGNGTFVYYILRDKDMSDFRAGGEYNRVSIIEIDTRTFRERVIYEMNIGGQKDTFLGVFKTDNSSQFLLTADAFFLDDSSIYFIDDGIWRVNRANGETNLINIPTNRSIAFDGRTIYYINSKYQLSKYDTFTGADMADENLIMTAFLMTDTKLLFLNRMDQTKLYSIDLKDGVLSKLSDINEYDAFDSVCWP